jgi:pyruvate/2-oxoglutarate dehydrogenase complex dihydrolipoamide acyltransferase (E2) component
MATKIVMPQLGESVAEGIIGKWLKQEGDAIGKDDPIVEVVTDKVNAEIPSPVAGTLIRISAAEGETVAIGQEIALIGDEGESTDSSDSSGQSEVQAQAGAAESGVETPRTSSPAPEPTSSSQSAAMGMGSSATAVLMPTDEGGNGASRRVVRSSPLVQRLAAEHNVDITQVEGTGIGGRVSKRDILQFIEGRTGSSAIAPSMPAIAPSVSAPPPPQPAPKPAAPSPAQPAGPNEEYVPISPVRRMIAEHMARSKFTIPHATSMIEVDMTPVVQYREAHKGAWQRDNGFSLSFMAFVAMATVESLRRHPLVNSEWGEDKIVVKKNINLGLAVAAANGLIVPSIKNADRLSLGGLAHAINDLTVRARAGKLTPDDVSGGTFTLNNTGAIGSVWSVSIINYPQAGILSADSIVKRVRVMPDDSIAIRHVMNLCMSFDHRTLDGQQISDFMQFIRKRLEAWPADCPL